MAGIIEVKVQVPKERLGDFIEDLMFEIPYANAVSVFPVVPGKKRHKQLLIEDHSQGAKTSPSIVLSKIQKQVLAALEGGSLTKFEIEEATGSPRVLRVLNTLKKKKLVKVSNGLYAITEK